MNPQAISLLFFVSLEAAKVIFNRLAQSGQYNDLSEAQAKALGEKIIAGLPTVLPSPEELIQQGEAGG